MRDVAEPTAMGILAWGNEIILTSSMKGAPSFFYDFKGGNTVIGEALEKCSILSQRHKNTANCAEPMSAHLYYKDIGITRKPLAAESPRIGVWVKQAETGWTQTDPCGTGETVRNRFAHNFGLLRNQLTNAQEFWGCNRLTEEVGIL